MYMTTCLLKELDCRMPHFMKAGQHCLRCAQTTKERMRFMELESLEVHSHWPTLKEIISKVLFLCKGNHL